MKFIAKATLVLVFAVAGVVVDGTLKDVGAHDGEVHAQQAQTKPPTPPASNQNTVYAYTAKEGDTYSYLARKAVQTYGKKANVKLSHAQIVYAETNLTQQAGSPLLDAGQKVQINESAVKQWVDKAKTLSADEQASWDYYVQFVDFNTDHIGNNN